LLPKAPPVYFPTIVGTKWVYEQKEYTMTLVISKVEAVEGGAIVCVESVSEGGKTTPIHKVLVSESGLAMTEEVGEAYTPHFHLLSLPHQPALRWQSTAKRVTAAGFDLTLGGTMTDRGEEEVQVPAGKFRALRVDADVSINGVARGGMSRWFAPGVGIVKEK